MSYKFLALNSKIEFNNQIEFFEAPEECLIEIEYDKHKAMQCHCEVDTSHGNVVTKVYDSEGEILATSLGDLVKMGATKAVVILKHEVDFSEVFSLL